MGNVELGRWYIPPHDSGYADVAWFGGLQTRFLQSGDTGGAIVVGNLNSRVWEKSVLETLVDNRHHRYQCLTDATVNPSGKRILRMCSGKSPEWDTLPKDDFQTGLSFRAKRWLSNWSLIPRQKMTFKLVSHSADEKHGYQRLTFVSRPRKRWNLSSHFLQTKISLQLPSDHAPLELEVEYPPGFTLGSLDHLMARSFDLSRTPELHQEKRLVTRGPLYSTVVLTSNNS